MDIYQYQNLTYSQLIENQEHTRQARSSMSRVSVLRIYTVKTKFIASQEKSDLPL